jgi:uncharacterized OsmC-like protein
MIYTSIEVVYCAKGNVNPESSRARLSFVETKYCGVHAMLEHSAKITTRYEIVGEPELQPT